MKTTLRGHNSPDIKLRVSNRTDKVEITGKQHNFLRKKHLIQKWKNMEIRLFD
jgi:carbamoylphosphate synthase small subunit